MLRECYIMVAIGALWEFYGTFTALLRKLSRLLQSVLQDSYGSVMGVLWENCGTARGNGEGISQWPKNEPDLLQTCYGTVTGALRNCFVNATGLLQKYCGCVTGVLWEC